jgi:Protein of unknown function (DUF1559)
MTIHSNRVQPLGRLSIKSLPLLAIGVWLATATSASAQQSDETAAQGDSAAAISSLLDDQTIAVLRIDVSQLDANNTAAWVGRIAKANEDERKVIATRMKRFNDWINRFRKAGGRDLYFVLSFDDFRENGPVICVPRQGITDRRGLDSLILRDKSAMPANRPFEFAAESCVARGGLLIFGSENQLKRLQNQTGAGRELPKELLGAVAQAEIELFVLPTDDQRRVLSEFFRDPQAEAAIFARLKTDEIPVSLRLDRNRIAPVALTDGLQWMALGIKTKGTPSATLVVGAKDADSAQALVLWGSALRQVVRQKLTAAAGPGSAEPAAIALLFNQAANLLKAKIEGNRVVIRVDAGELANSPLGALVGSGIKGALRTARKTIERNHLKQIALAMHNFHDVSKHFPPQAIRDKQGRPFLSWRVSLLPFLDPGLYRQFHLDEPWDGPHNKALLAKMPEVFAPENEELRDEGKTTILVPVGDKTIFGPIEGVAIKDITDGTSNTILAIDASEKRAVPWTKPADLNVDVSDVQSAIFGGRDQAICAFADGSVRVLSSRIPASTLQSFLTRNAGDVIPSADQ